MRSMRKSLLMAALSCCLPMYMSDPEAAAPSSTEPVTAENAPQEAGASAAGETPAPPAEAAPVDISATTSAAGAESVSTQDVGESANNAATPARESLIAHMHALFDALEAKIATGVHVFAHEVAALRDHVKSVL